MRRWLVVLLALLAAAATLYLLLSTAEPAGEPGPARAEIDPESRAKLLEVLREERAE